MCSLGDSLPQIFKSPVEEQSDLSLGQNKRQSPFSVEHECDKS